MENLKFQSEDESNILTNNEYRKLDKKIYQDSSSDTLEIMVGLKIRIKVNQENLAPNPRRNILKKVSAPIIEKRAIGRNTILN